MSKKKHILKSDTSAKIYTFGISTSETEFQLSLLLNNILNIRLTVAPTIEREIKNQFIKFPCFKFDNEDILSILLIKNKQNNNAFFSNQQAFDFILIITGEESVKISPSVENKLKTGNNISMVANIDPKKLSGLKSLLK